MVNQIPKWASSFVSDLDLKNISAAIHRAELTTSGEIVPIVAKSSVPYFIASKNFSFTLVGIAAVLILIGDDFHIWPNWEIRYAIFLFIMAVAFFSKYLFKRGWPISLGLNDMEFNHFVSTRAEIEFYRHGLNNTAGATGILLFVSLFEKRAVVLADKSIADKLPKETWDQVVKTLIDNTKQNKMGHGFSAAIEQCEKLLSPHFPPTSQNPDELGNKLVFVE